MALFFESPASYPTKVLLLAAFFLATLLYGFASRKTLTWKGFLWEAVWKLAFCLWLVFMCGMYSSSAAKHRVDADPRFANGSVVTHETMAGDTGRALNRFYLVLYYLEDGEPRGVILFDQINGEYKYTPRGEDAEQDYLYSQYERRAQKTL